MNSLCPIPWNHLAIQHNGDLRQCCQMVVAPPYGKFLDDGKALRFDPTSIEDIRNHPSLKQLRAQMMQGEKPSACALCWTEEAAGIGTKRLYMLDEYPIEPLLEHTAPDGSIDTEAIPLRYLDLRLGNLCNLKCRSCGPADSSLWFEDHAILNGTGLLDYYGSKRYQIIGTSSGWTVDSDDFDWHNDPTFHAWLDEKFAHGLDRLYFTGGEPTINKSHFQILERIVELGRAGDMTLEYNSNMTTMPQRLLDLWRHFKYVGIGASIDAIGPLAHYIRHPSKWETIERHCDEIGYGQLPNVEVGLATTISALNIRHFLDLSRWLVRKGYTTIGNCPKWHLLHGPAHLSIQVLPDEIKVVIEREYEEYFAWITDNFGEDHGKMVRTSYAGIVRFMRQRSTTDLLPTLKVITTKLDQLRRERLSEQIPWLAEILAKVD